MIYEETRNKQKYDKESRIFQIFTFFFAIFWCDYCNDFNQIPEASSIACPARASVWQAMLRLKNGVIYLRQSPGRAETSIIN